MKTKKVDLLQSVLTVQGNIFKNDGRRRIDLKKPIVDLFEPLETAKNHLNYVMELCLNQNNVVKRTNQLVKDHIVPILFYFVKDDDDKIKIESDGK